jgi:TonB family protein
MRYLLSTLITLLLATYLVTPSTASNENRNFGLASSDKNDIVQTGATDAQAKGEVDLLLEKLEKDKRKVIDRCLENCKDSGNLEGGRIVSKPQPRYPSDARANGITGAVVVQIVVDETGKVIAAQPMSGPAQLLKAATQSARQARFRPTKLSGQPVKVTGTITFNFTL